jgi:hypothetical protein
MLVGDCTMGFLISHPVCQYSVTPGIAHARSKTEVMTSFSRSVHPPDCTRLRKQPAWDQVRTFEVRGWRQDRMVVKRRPTYKPGEPLLIILSNNVGTEVVARYLVSLTLSALMRSLHSNGNGPHTFRNYIDD